MLVWKGTKIKLGDIGLIDEGGNIETCVNIYKTLSKDEDESP